MAKPKTRDATEALIRSMYDIGRLRAALEPFAAIADLVNHTDQRDGETVFRLPNPKGGYFTLVRDDFRRAAIAFALS